MGWGMYTKQINVTDRPLREKTSEVTNAHNEVSGETAKVDFKLSREWSGDSTNEMGSNLSKATAIVLWMIHFIVEKNDKHKKDM